MTRAVLIIGGISGVVSGLLFIIGVITSPSLCVVSTMAFSFASAIEAL